MPIFKKEKPLIAMEYRFRTERLVEIVDESFKQPTNYDFFNF